MCNPPYVITTDEELCNAKKHHMSNIGIEASWAGGKLGCDSVTNSLIQILPHILSPKGNCFTYDMHKIKSTWTLKWIHLNINFNWVNLYYLEYVKLLLLGVCYIVLEKSNNPDKVADYAASYGFEHSIVIERRAGREYLLVMKLVRK